MNWLRKVFGLPSRVVDPDWLSIKDYLRRIGADDHDYTEPYLEPSIPPPPVYERPHVAQKVTVSTNDIQRVYEQLNILAELVPYVESDGPLDVINRAEMLGLIKHVEAQELRRDWNYIRCYEEGIPLPGTVLHG